MVQAGAQCTGGICCPSGYKACDGKYCIPSNGVCCGSGAGSYCNVGWPLLLTSPGLSNQSMQIDDVLVFGAHSLCVSRQGIIVSHPVPSAAPTDKVVLAVLPAAVVRVKRLAKADAFRATLCAAMLARGSIAM
jgi:hypothetical protein